MNGTALSKFKKIVGMLGSDHDGERANAARMASAILKQNGLDWSAVAVGKGESSSVNGHSAADWAMMARSFQRLLDDERARTNRLTSDLAAATRRIKALESHLSVGKPKEPPPKKPPPRAPQPRQSSSETTDDDLRDEIDELLASTADLRSREFLESVQSQPRWSAKQREAVIKVLRWARKDWV